MQGRTANHLLLTSVRHNPGPGQYEPKLSMNKIGVFYVSKMKNSLAPSFSLPSLKRFNYNDKQTRMVPGPGAYDPKIEITDQGAAFLSTISGPRIKSFYHSDRNTICIPASTKSKNTS